MTTPNRTLRTDRDPRSNRESSDRDGPRWPPRHGTKIVVYLPNAADPLFEYRCEVDNLAGSILSVVAPKQGEQVAVATRVKVFFAGDSTGWGYDGEIITVERSAMPQWQIQIRNGPIEVERRESRRVPERTIVLLKCGEAVVPAHILDRSELGMRCISGRGAGVEVGKVLTVKSETIQGLFGVSGTVVWRRSTPHGIEYGVSFA